MLSESVSIMIAAPAFEPSERLQLVVINTGKRQDQASRMVIGNPSLKLGRMNADASRNNADFAAPNVGPTNSILEAEWSFAARA